MVGLCSQRCSDLRSLLLSPGPSDDLDVEWLGCAFPKSHSKSSKEALGLAVCMVLPTAGPGLEKASMNQENGEKLA